MSHRGSKQAHVMENDYGPHIWKRQWRDDLSQQATILLKRRWREGVREGNTWGQRKQPAQPGRCVTKERGQRPGWLGSGGGREREQGQRCSERGVKCRQKPLEGFKHKTDAAVWVPSLQGHCGCCVGAEDRSHQEQKASVQSRWERKLPETTEPLVVGGGRGPILELFWRESILTAHMLAWNQSLLCDPYV